LSILCLSLCLQAQTSEKPKNSIHEALTFHLLDVESGLSNNFINSIEEDDLGRLWFATADGLNRFDGSMFEHYKTSQPNGLSNNNISQLLFDDHNKTMLLATDNGVNIYYPKLDKFIPLLSKTIKQSQEINCLTKNADGKIFVSILRSKEGLFIANKAADLVPYNHFFDLPNHLSVSEISCMAMQQNTTLWLGTFHNGLFKLNLKSNKLEKVPLNNNLSSASINTVFIDDKQQVWVGTKKGLGILTSTGAIFSLQASNKFEKGLSDSNVLSIAQDNKGMIWIGTRNGGLNILNGADFIQYNQLNIKWYLAKNDGTSVFNRTVSCIKKDQNGQMWLGTSTGVNFVNTNDEPVKLIKHSNAINDGISHNRIGSLALAKNQKIWIGTDGAGLDLFDPSNNSFKHFRHDPNNQNSLSNNFIISAYEDTKDRVWVGTYQGGINLLNPETGISKRYLSEEDIRVIFEDENHQIWVGANRGGLFLYDDATDVFNYVAVMGKLDIRDIKQGKNQSLWLATFGDGIFQFFPKNKTIKRFNTKTVKNLPTNVFYTLEILNNDKLMMGSRYEGLIILDSKTKTFSRFTEADGLSNNSVVSILKESEEHYWLGTNNGINRYHLKSNKAQNLSSLNNIQTSAFNINVALKSKEGYLYFGGNKGLNIFYPKRLENIHENYRLIFNKLTVLNATVDISEDQSNTVLKSSIGYADTIHLNHNQSLFSVGYTLVKYPKAKNVSYSYMLEGYQDQWIKTYGTNQANFSKIPPGKYVLRVKANLDSGKEIMRKINVVISPPFWKTVPAYLLYILIAVLLIYFGIRYYSERIKLQNSLIFEKRQRQLEHDLNEERLYFFTNFSHELKTPLTLIMAPIDDIMKDVQSQKSLKNLQIIKKNAAILYGYIQKLLDFRKSESGHMQLELQSCILNEVIHQICLSFEPLAHKKGILLKLSLPLSEVKASIDLEKFQIILNNLLSNALNHTNKKGEVCVSLETSENNFTLLVKDTGPGIDKNDLPYIFNWYYQAGNRRKKGTGVGLALSKNFVELHKGNITASNNENSPGVTFVVTIPINKEFLITSNELDTISVEADHHDTSAFELIEDIEKPNNILHNSSRKLVLLVDDNKDILTYLETLLSNEFDLIFAVNGEEGIQKALEYIPDIIVSDVMMPEKTGVELCNYLKNELSTSHIPIILLTAKGNSESIKTGIDEGADDYVTKPFNSNILLSRLKNLLKNREILQQYYISQEPLNKQLSSSNLKMIDKEKQFLMELKSCILANIKDQENLNVDTIAREMGLSRSSLYRKLNTITGHNINDFIRKVRLEKALYLIKNEGLTISQASYEVGFNSVNYFRKIFKLEYGKLPSELK